MTDLAADIRKLLADNRSLSIMRTFDDQWQVNVRRRSDGHAYGVYYALDPIDALRKAFRVEHPQPAPGECQECADTGWRDGEFGNPCDCGRRQLKRDDLFGEIWL